ncbi:MAG TPA: AAA family ATPase, partial [Trueperaceae bacterium]
GVQCNAFDLVRLHLFGSLDSEEDKARPVTERPSYHAMCQLALQQPEVQQISAASDYALIRALGPLTEPEKIEHGAEGLARRIRDVLDTPTNPEWLIEDVLERDVIAILAGPRGSYKSFLALDWSMRVAVEQKMPVYVISAEGRDFDRRALAWFKSQGVDGENVPLFVVERRLDLSTREGIEMIRQDCVRLRIRPRLFVLDTFSKLSGSLEENDNTAVKQFIGLLDNGLRRSFDATVLLVAHTGHSTQSRARGASALAADTDAEYIVSRNPGFGTISVSRERFKSSPELPPLCYAPKVIDLGRQDNKGRPVTSLVLEPAQPPEVPKGKRRPTGVQQVTLELVERMTPFGESVAIADVVAAVVAKTPKPTEGRDMRKRAAQRAIESLVQNGWLFLDGDERVARVPMQPMREGV